MTENNKNDIEFINSTEYYSSDFQRFPWLHLDLENQRNISKVFVTVKTNSISGVY